MVVPARPVLITAITTAVVAPVAVLAMVVFAGVTGGPDAGCVGDGGAGGGAQRLDNRVWDAEQTTNARTITATALARGLPRRAAVVAVAAAIVESDLRNVHTGDRDSLGLFQQRPSQGWGSPAQVLNPVAATGMFFDHLASIPQWDILPAGVAEQQVERSAYPDRYAPAEPAATALVRRFWDTADNTADNTANNAVKDIAGTSAGAVEGCADQGASNLDAAANHAVTVLPATYRLPADPVAAAAVGYALHQTGKPYRWGAAGPDAFDCSGLVQAAWAFAGVALSAGTTSQVHDGLPVAGLTHAQPGDLLFIPGSLGTPTHPRHVGLDIGDGLVVDAYDSRHGVIIEPLAAWAGRIVAIRRITPTPGLGVATGGEAP